MRDDQKARKAIDNGPENPGAFVSHILKYQTETAFRQFLEQRYWPNGPVCAHCKGTKAYKLNDKKYGVYKCASCLKRFSITTKTVFEGTHIPLPKWFIAIYHMMCSKKSISALQLSRMLGISYESCWFMCHRIRHAFRTRKKRKHLQGVVEVDETYLGGKKKPGIPGRGVVGKTPVFGMVQRKGAAVLSAVPNVRKATVERIIAEHVYSNAKIFTDDNGNYVGLKKKYDHRKVVHSKKEYARREGNLVIHTNTIEGVFGLVKRAIMGAYHHVSPEKLPLYCDEWSLRYTHKDIDDAPRFERALDDASGRLTWYFKKGGIMKGCVPVGVEVD